jgi:lipopolysaccharide transport system ATP-binding protein
MMGSTVRFALSYQIFEQVNDLSVSIALCSGRTGEIVTSVKYPISERDMTPGNKNTLIIEFPEIDLRPGEYPLYFWLGNHRNQAFDVVDNLTAPLIIGTDKDIDELGFNPSGSDGFFNIESRLIHPKTKK